MEAMQLGQLAGRKPVGQAVQYLNRAAGTVPKLQAVVGAALELQAMVRAALKLQAAAVVVLRPLRQDRRRETK
jgi:hypothetical protein